jgi:hypothetical protein
VPPKLGFVPLPPASLPWFARLFNFLLFEKEILLEKT